MKPADVASALRARLGADRDVRTVDAVTFELLDESDAARVDVSTRAAGTVLVVRMEITQARFHLPRGFRLTRATTARGQSRGVQELRLGDDAFDELWAIEGSAQHAPTLHALMDALAPLARFDAVLDCLRPLACVEVRSGTGLLSFSPDALDALGGALLSLWSTLTTQPAPADDAARARAHSQVVTAQLTAIADVVAARCALFAGAPARVGDALEARVTQPLGVDELWGTLRVRPASEDGIFLVRLDAAIGVGAPTGFVRTVPGMLGGRKQRIDLPAGVDDARAIEQLARARQVDVRFSDGALRAEATSDGESLSDVLEGMLELWRLVRGA